MIPTVGAAVFIFAGSARSNLTGRLISNPVAVYVGKISYPLYLVHWPIHVFAATLLGEGYGIFSRTSMFFLSLILATAIYELAEKPIRRGLFLRRDRNLLTLYAGSISACLAFFFVAIITSGLPQRYPPDVAQLAAFADDKSPPLTECEYLGQSLSKIADFCLIGDRSAHPNWLVYGDSHAWAAHGAFDKWLSKSGQSGLFIFRHSCPPLEGLHLFKDLACFSFNQKILAFIDAAKDVRNVLLVSTWRQAPEGILTNSEQILPSKEGSLALFQSAFTKTVSRLHDDGVVVFIWEPVPGAKANVPSSLAEAAYSKVAPDLEFSREEYKKEFSFFFEALLLNKSMIAGTISPSDALCSSGKCSVTIDNRPAYFDNGHLAASNSDFWARVLEASTGTRNAQRD